MARTAPLTLSEHQALASHLQAIHLALLDDLIDLSSRLGKTSREATLTRRAIKVVNTLRSELENRKCRDFGAGPNYTYFGCEADAFPITWNSTP